MDNIDKLVLRHCFFPPGNAERLLGTAFTQPQPGPDEQFTIKIQLAQQSKPPGARASRSHQTKPAGAYQ
jgi:hypothetical protein